MLLSDSDIRFAISEARNVAQLYHQHVLNSGATRKSIDGLLDLFPRFIQKEVDRYELPTVSHKGKAIRGFCIKGPDRYQICLLAEMNFCWRRIVTCKEIFHVIIDDARYQTTNIWGHLEEVVASLQVPIVAGPAVVSEALAEIAAMEFMFPYEDRRRILALGSTDYREIAQRYKIPHAFVELYLAPSFMKSLGEVYDGGA